MKLVYHFLRFIFLKNFSLTGKRLRSILSKYATTCRNRTKAGYASGYSTRFKKKFRGRWSPKKLLRGALIGAGFRVSLAVTALGVYRFLNGDPEDGHLAKFALVGAGAGFGAVINGAGIVRGTIYEHFWADVFNIPHHNYD